MTAIVVMKGGPGSGFTSEHGHAGIPGEQGGSQHNGTMADFEKAHYKDSREWNMAIDASGKVLYSSSGASDHVDMPYDVAYNLKGGVYTHTHPVNVSFSMADIAIAVKHHFGEIRAVAADVDGKMVIYSMKPKEDTKWPNKEQFNWNIDGVVNEIRQFYPKDKGDVRQAADYYNIFWKSLAPRVGLIYTETRP
jgi:hypothetical protein